jgi:holin-like protein
MKALQQLALLLLVALAADMLTRYLHIAFPGSVLGMIIMLILLSLKIIKPEHIEETSGFLLTNMAFFFIPAGVGIINSLSLISQYGLFFILTILVTTFLVMGITALVIDLMVKTEHHDDTVAE